MDASVTGSVSGQMNFGGDGSIVTVTTKQFTGVNIVDISVDNVVYHIFAPEPDSIVISDLITEGTKIGRISINGVNYDIYAPTDGSGSDVSVIPLLDHGTEIASITVDGETAHIFAPTPQTVSATAQYDTGVLVGNINIGGNITYFYIPDYGADITSLDNRLDIAEGDITALDLRVDTAEDNITSLTGRVGTAEGNITGLTTRMGTAEGNITGLTNRMGAAEGNITNLSGRMTEAENDITALGIECDAIAADLAAPYDEEETYSVGDYCTHDKVLYICNTAISTPEEWDISHWDAVKVCDDITEIKQSLSVLIGQLQQQVTNLNDPLLNGCAYITFNTYPASASNKPTGNTGIIMTYGNGRFRQQVAFELAGEIYTRYSDNGSITVWTKRG